MTSAFRWLLPHPLLTLLLAVVWTLLQNDVTAGMVVFGLILGVIILLFTVGLEVRLDDVVLRTLAKEPELRYQRAREVKTAVESIDEMPPPTAASVKATSTAPISAQSKHMTKL